MLGTSSEVRGELDRLRAAAMRPDWVSGDRMAWDISAVELPAMAVGVHVHAEPRRLQATLDSLRAHAPGAAVVLLPDGPDEPTRAALAAIELPQLGTREPRGGPASLSSETLGAYRAAAALQLTTP